MSIGIQAAKIRLLDTRQSFRLGAEHRLEPDEWPELATHRFCLPQTEPVDHLIASAPYVEPPESITHPKLDEPHVKHRSDYRVGKAGIAHTLIHLSVLCHFKSKLL